MLFPFSGVQMQQRHTPPLGLSRHCVEGQVGHQSSLNNSPGSTRIEFEAARTAAGVGGGRVVVWFRCCVFVVVGPRGFPGALAGLGATGWPSK